MQGELCQLGRLLAWVATASRCSAAGGPTITLCRGRLKLSFLLLALLLVLSCGLVLSALLRVD
eukprot:COSAG01_NODE_36661_length_514_cov_0.925301_1_plen_63_part_00